MNIESSKQKANKLENYENPHNADPYDIWKTNDEETSKTKPSQKLEDILGNKNNLWILKHENELSQAVSKNYKR